MFVFVSCKKPLVQPAPNKQINAPANKFIVVNGEKYFLVKEEKKLGNGKSEVALYKKEGVTDRYYTPSHSGNLMVSVAK